MKEFKGSGGKWGCVFTADKIRAVRNKGGLICKLITPRKFSGQDERYDSELEETRCNQVLIASAPEMLEALQGAMRIVDLWAPKYSQEERKECDISELAALYMMRQAFEKAIKKAVL